MAPRATTADISAMVQAAELLQQKIRSLADAFDDSHVAQLELIDSILSDSLCTIQTVVSRLR